MDSIEHGTARFTSTRQQIAEVTAWRAHYDGLVAELGRLGSEVRRSRALERDEDVPPGNFVRDASHVFIFPPQVTTVGEARSEAFDSTPGYRLDREEFKCAYDPAEVRGRLEVRYDDADSRVFFAVYDRKEGGSELPEDVVAALAIVRHVASQ